MNHKIKLTRRQLRHILLEDLKDLKVYPRSEEDIKMRVDDFHNPQSDINSDLGRLYAGYKAGKSADELLELMIMMIDVGVRSSDMNTFSFMQEDLEVVQKHNKLVDKTSELMARIDKIESMLNMSQPTKRKPYSRKPRKRKKFKSKKQDPATFKW